MKFSQELIPGTLIIRYKRFLADICLEDGSICFISGCGYQTRCQTFTGFNPAKIRRKSCCHFFLFSVWMGTDSHRQTKSIRIMERCYERLLLMALRFCHIGQWYLPKKSRSIEDWNLIYKFSLLNI